MADRAVAVVTGAASGIGREIALRLATLGYDLAAVDADGEGIETVAAAIKTRCLARRMDVCDPAAWDGLAAELRERRVAVLVNSAGLLLAGRLADCRAEDLRRIVEVNLFGVMLGCRTITPLLAATEPRIPRRQRELPIGVLNIASVFAPLAPPGFSAYSATKAGVVTLGETLREEVRPDRLTVTTVLPGVTPTGLFDRAHYADERLRDATRDYLAAAELSAGDVAELALKAFRRRRRSATIGRRAARYALAKRLAPALVGKLIGRRARRALRPA